MAYHTFPKLQRRIIEKNLLRCRATSGKEIPMKRLHLQIIYGQLWILTMGILLLIADFLSHLAVLSGQARAIAWFMILLGPFFFTLYLLTAFLFDTREGSITSDQFKTFLQRRRTLIGLFVFSMILFVLLTFYGVSFKK